MRKFVIAILAIILLLTGAPVGTAGAQGAEFPDTIALPDGYFPEGIAKGRGTQVFVGSLSDGTIWKGDVRTGEGDVFTAPTGQFSTVGLDVDHKNRVWAAGGPTGLGRVYNGRTGELLAAYDLTAAGESFINDVIVTRDAAYFTDSGSRNTEGFAGEPRLFRVDLGRRGRIVAPGDATVVEIELVNVPDLAFPNLNGIERSPGNSGLIVAHSSLGALFHVDPATGIGTDLDVRAELDGADGLARRGRTLYVVENAASEITPVRINPRRGTARVRPVLPVAEAETPTTAAIFGRAIYTVDARFTSGAGPYNIFRIPL